jgi:hypothetical protein
MSRWEIETRRRSASPHGLMGLAGVAFSGSVLQAMMAPLDHFFCSLTGWLVRALPGLLLTMCRVLEPRAADLERLLECAQVAAAFLPLIRCLLGLG